MRKRTNGKGLLVAVELGGEWPSCLEQLQAPPTLEVGGRRVITQMEGESPACFTERIAQIVASDELFGRGVRLWTLAIACNERLDEAASSSRRKLASAALGDMARHKSGRVYLTASPRSSGRLRHALSALARELSNEWHAAGLEATVEFGDGGLSAPISSPLAPLAPIARVA